MSLQVFGKGDILAFPKLKSGTAIMGATFAFAEVSLDWCYSKYGFALPLTFTGIPLDMFVEDRMPVLPMPRHVGSQRYILVDHQGNVWNIVSAGENEDGIGFDKQALNIFPLHRQVDSWWVHQELATKDEEYKTSNELLGFLSVNPPKEEIDKYFYNYHRGKSVEWMSIDTIVKTLHERFPVETDTSTNDKLAAIAEKMGIGLEELMMLVNVANKGL